MHGGVTAEDHVALAGSLAYYAHPPTVQDNSMGSDRTLMPMHGINLQLVDQYADCKGPVLPADCFFPVGYRSLMSLYTDP